MKITAIRVRVLRSRPVGYGHDAAEIEAQLEDGDDPDEVTAELRRRCEAEVRQAHERDRMLDSLDSLRERVRREEEHLAGVRTQLARANKSLGEYEGFAEAAAKKGLALPPGLRDLSLPF